MIVALAGGFVACCFLMAVRSALKREWRRMDAEERWLVAAGVGIVALYIALLIEWARLR